MQANNLSEVFLEDIRAVEALFRHDTPMSSLCQDTGFPH